MKGDTFPNESEPKTKTARISALKNGLTFDEKKYEYKDDFVPADINNPLEVHTTSELIECLQKHKNVDIEARILGMSGDSRSMVKMDKKQFLESVKKRDSKKLRETTQDFFNNSNDPYIGSGMIGQDFTPLLGGPFNKQLYYRDFLRMVSACFYAFHHDPVARNISSIITDFTIGRGFHIDVKGKDKDKGQLIWDAFKKVNNLDQQFDHIGTELSALGEVMIWKLPKNQARISFNPMPGETVPTAAIPRVRLIDPSNIAEIITVPEDMIEGVLAYVWLAPTQYQMFTDGKQPSTKFIYTQIPADQMLHFKVNSFSNEKRGRSDFFPALGYMKRLRDSVNYSLVAQQKAAAWAIDTTIKGSKEDIDQYIEDQISLGSIPSAGSEFVHTEAITRQYLSNSATGKSSDSPTFNWCLDMICMASGIPVGYLGTHVSGQGTRASALVATEPVAKRFERRRLVYDRILQSLFDYVMRYFGLNCECDIIWPELITQDRSAKMRDLTIAQNNGWISKETAATVAAKEFDLKDYDYDKEKLAVKAEPPVPTASPTSTNPLTTPSKAPQTKGVSSGTMTGPEKTKVKNDLRQL